MAHTFQCGGRPVIRKGLIGIFLTCAALVVIAIYFMLLTSSGLRLCIGVAEKLSQGRLSVGTVHGRLLYGFELEGISYTDSFGTVQVHNISLSWRPYELLNKKVLLTSFRVTDVTVETATSANAANHDDQEEANAGFVLPLTVHMQKGYIGPISIISGDNQERTEFSSITLEDLSLQEDMSASGQLAVTSETLHIEAKGNVDFADEISTDLTIEFNTGFAGMAAMTGNASLEGTLQQLGYEIRLSSPSVVHMKGFMYEIAEQFHWEGVVTADTLVLDTFAADWPGFSFKQLKIQGEGDASAYSAVVEGVAAYDKLTDIIVNGEVKGDGNGLQFEGVRLEKDETRLMGDGTLAWQEGLTWQVTLLGSEVDLAMIDPQWSETIGLTAEIDGNENGLRLNKIILDKNDARLKGEGTLSWEQGLAWQLNLSGNEIDPGIFQSQWPGRLQFNATTSGQSKNGIMQAGATLKDLAGELRGYPISASGEVGMDGDRFTIRELNIQSADSILRIAGSSGKSMNMEFSLNSPDLGTVWPDLSGLLSVSGQVRGSPAEPQVDFEMTGQDIRYQDTGLASLNGKGRGVLETGGAVDVSLTARDVVHGEHSFNSVALEIQGELQKHVLELSATASRESASVRFEGGYADKRWNGVVSNGMVRSAQFGNWQLQGPAVLNFSRADAALQRFCLADQTSSAICINGSYSLDEWSLNTTVDSFALQNFESMQNTLHEMNGVFSGTLSARGKGASLKYGELELTADNISSRLVLTENVIHPLVVKKSSLSVKTEGEAFNIQIQGVMEDNSTIRLDGLMKGIALFPFDNHSAGFSGTIGLNIIDLSALEALMYPRAELFGTLVGEVDVTGSLNQPQLSGKLSLDKGRAIFPEQGITVENLTLHLEGLVDRLKVSLNGTSGGGLIQAAGFLPLSLDKKETVAIQVSGEGFEVMNTPEMNVRLSPDLQLRMSSTRKELIGKVLVSEALFAPVSLQGVVQPSDDVVFVHGEEEDATTSLPFHTDLHIIAGEKVQVRAFGLRGLIVGQLHIVSEPSRPILLEGNLDIREGTYSVYGRQLNIVRGYLLYSGNQPDNPGVDIRAENTAGGVTTGIEVSGFLQEPEIGFYSNPAMEKDEIIRRLLLNTSLVGSSEDEGFLESVTSDTGIDPVTSAVMGVKEGLRLDDIKIESGKESEDVSLVIGSWLTPKLYVSYGQNLLKQSGSFNTKYLLGYGFSLETESGATDNGVDLIYEIDKW